MMEEEQGLSNEGQNTLYGNVIREMIIVDFSYVVRNWFGRIKLLQFIFVTLAGIISPSVIYGLYSRYAFFVFIVWTSFIYIILDLLLHFTSLWRRLPKLMTSPSVLIVPLLVGILAFLIGSSLIASASFILRGYRSTTSVLAAICGFIVMVLYGVEAFLHFRTMNNRYPATAGNPQANLARNRPISHPVTVEIVNPDPPPYKESDGRGVFVAPVTTFH